MRWSLWGTVKLVMWHTNDGPNNGYTVVWVLFFQSICKPINNTSKNLKTPRKIIKILTNGPNDAYRIIWAHFLCHYLLLVHIHYSIYSTYVKTCFKSDLEHWSFGGKSYKRTWLQLQCCALTRYDLVSVNFNVQRCSEVHGKIEIGEMISGNDFGGAEYGQV